MGQNETDQATCDLSKAQLTAMEALLTGSTVTCAASVAGVARTTVHRWLRQDWDFQAELNRLKREVRDATEMRLLSAAESAARTEGYQSGTNADRHRFLRERDTRPERIFQPGGSTGSGTDGDDAAGPGFQSR